MSEHAVINEPTSEGEIAQEAIREELSRILESSIFVQSDQLGRFLRYTVETTLAGDAETLKEYLIGTEVYERKLPSHEIVEQEVRNGRQRHQHLRPLRSGNRGRREMGSGKGLRASTRRAGATIPPLPRGTLRQTRTELLGKAPATSREG